MKAEVIEIVGNVAKIQVFEDTRGVRLNTPVEFTAHLLEAELGPGLLTSIFDGLQNPLEKVADATGSFSLARRLYAIRSTGRATGIFIPAVKVAISFGEAIVSAIRWKGGFTMRSWSLSLSLANSRITWVIKPGSYTIDTVVARAVDEKGKSTISR